MTQRDQEGGFNHARGERQYQRASDHDDRKWTLSLGTDFCGKGCWQKTECCHQRRHQARAESLFRCSIRGVFDR